MPSPQHSQGISINELTSRLKLGRNYITRNITHCVEHIEASPSKGTPVIYNERMLREYLVRKSTFTRQTRRINLEQELQEYKTKHPNDERIQYRDFEKLFIGKIPNWAIAKRSELPAIPLESADFWDYPLIFPKEYTQGDDSPDAKTKTAEICYRDMFKVGAIKIQLGRQKTMFYIPEEKNVTIPPLNELTNLKYDDFNCYLVPADWEPFYKGSATPPINNKEATKVEITIKTDSADFDQTLLEKALRQGFVIDHISFHEQYDNMTEITYQARIIHDFPDKTSSDEQNI